MTNHPQGFNRQLAGLRAVAVCAVVFLHSGLPGFRGGYLGVDLFFVLSGFLITNVLQRAMNSGGPYIFDFYWRRFLRLFPALALVCIAVVVVHSMAETRVRDAIASITYIANWTTAFGTGTPVYLGHTWSLAIEEQFYLLWPLLLMLIFWAVPRNKAAAIAVGLALAVMAWRGYAALNGVAFSRIYNGFDMRADGLLLGCALSLATFGDASRFLRVKMGGAALVALVVMAGLWFFMDVSETAMLAFGYSAASICLAVIVAYIALPYSRPAIVDRVLGSGPMVWIGEISYGLYLWHFPITFYLNTEKSLHWSVKVPITVLASLLLAAVSYYAMEKPLLRRHAKSASTALAGKISVAYSVLAFSAGMWVFFSGNIMAAIQPDKLVQIEAYGPMEMKAGVPFNIQADGSSALWMNTDRTASTATRIKLGDVILPHTSVGSKMATALVSLSQLPPAGIVSLYLVRPDGTPASNKVTVTVTHP